MSRRGPRARRVLALTAAVAFALTGCAKDVYVKPTTPVGRANAATAVLVDSPAEKPVTGVIKGYLHGRKAGFRYGAGDPDDIAETVKNGRLIDVVVLPAGPGLDRVKDELLQPPLRLGRIGSTDYYLGTVTSKGLLFTKWLQTLSGQAQLRLHGVS